LKKLTELNVSFNYLNSLPLTVGNMPSLQCLDIEGNPLIELPKNFAQEKNCCKKVLKYYQDLQHSSSPWGDIKVVFLGDNNAGKTSVMWSLINHKKKKLFNIGTKRNSQMVCVHTEQIDMVPFSSKSHNFQLWDFAGSDCYYDICDIYLTNRTCYVVTFNMSSHHHDHELQYWVNLVKDKEDCSILIVGTHMEAISKQEFLKIQNAVSSAFPSIPFFALNNKNYKGVKEVEDHLRHIAESLSKNSVPCTYLAIKEWISNAKLNGQKFMTMQQFKELVEGVNLDVNQCLKYLHDSGSIVWIEAVNLLLLDSCFLLEAWNSFVSSKNLMNEGCILRKDLVKIWSNYTPDTFENLLQTLLSYHKIELFANEDNNLDYAMLSSTVKRNSHGNV
jgi:internalin A